MKTVDAIGKACPMPVIMAKKEMDHGETRILITVDNAIAVENLKRLANNQGFELQVEEKEGNFHVMLSKDMEEGEVVMQTKEEVNVDTVKQQDYVVFLGKDHVGEGDETLGRSLMQMFLYTLTQSEELPTAILCMNGGVKLPVEDQQCIDHFIELEKKGVKLLVCGACLNYYGIAEQLKVGTVSNMYDIVEMMKKSGKVITM